jgi:hypothetical protein
MQPRIFFLVKFTQNPKMLTLQSVTFLQVQTKRRTMNPRGLPCNQCFSVVVKRNDVCFCAISSFFYWKVKKTYERELILRHFQITFKKFKNRFQRIDSASLCSLAGRYVNTIPTRFLTPIDCLKIPAQLSRLVLSSALLSPNL